MDLFNPTLLPKDLAITRAIEQAVENFIDENFAEADHYFKMAETFVHSSEEYFAPTTNNKETHAV